MREASCTINLADNLSLDTDNGGFTVAQIQVTWTQVIALAAGVVLTVGTGAFLRLTKLGTAMRHDPGLTPAPYVAGILLAVRRVADAVGVRRGLDSLLFGGPA